MNKTLIIVVVVLVLVGISASAFVWFSRRPAPTSAPSIATVTPRPTMVPKQLTAALSPVARGSKAAGSVKLIYSGTSSLVASFTDLPAPPAGYFYEGWLVKSNPPSAITTGRVVQVDSVYTNIFGSAEDLTVYNQFVLTLEPDDSDPAPAGHILEGRLVSL